MNTRSVRFALFAASLLGITPMWAQSSTAQARQLEQRYKGMLLRVRDLVSDSKVRYDAAGNLTGKWHPGRWTWHSSVEVTKVEMKDRLLKIQANRLLLNYNRGTHLFVPVRSGAVNIEIETSPGADGNIDVEKEWNKAFLKPAEEYPLDMQPYWKPFIACVIRPKTDECEYYEKKSWAPDVYKINPTSNWKPDYPNVHHVGGDVKPPKVKSRVEPEYNEVARAGRVTGTVLLEAIVTKQGGIQILRVIRPLGYGLEENAAEALSQWVFEPGTRMGQPVDVLLDIEVNFNLR
jgi:TonB family protein